MGISSGRILRSRSIYDLLTQFLLLKGRGQEPLMMGGGAGEAAFYPLLLKGQSLMKRC